MATTTRTVTRPAMTVAAGGAGRVPQRLAAATSVRDGGGSGWR
jgi:hypothetical protein